MKLCQYLFLLSIVLVSSCTSDTKEYRDYTSLVNPFIGTGGNKIEGHGNTFPGAAYPFGINVPKQTEANGQN
jgi:putative alpha-1,2-mannosidase